MRSRYLSYIINVILIVGIIVYIKACQPDPLDQIIEIEYVPVEIPQIRDSIIEKRIPVPVPVEIETVDSTWYNKYQELKTQKEKDSLFNEAIKENKYLETYEDEQIKIDVFTKTRGEILEQNIPEYIIKPRTVTVPQTTITKIKPPKMHVYGGVQVGLPTNTVNSSTPLIKGDIFIQGKKGNITTFGFDSEKTVWVGKVWRFW